MRLARLFVLNVVGVNIVELVWVSQKDNVEKMRA